MYNVIHNTVKKHQLHRKLYPSSVFLYFNVWESSPLNELRKFYIFVSMKLNVFNWEVIELLKEAIDGRSRLNNLNKERKI